MTRSQVRISADAEIRLNAIRAWWVPNRPAAPGLFDREFDAAIEAIAEAPTTFPIYRQEMATEVRRVLLCKTRYAVYYATESATTLIVAVWHTRRGQLPPLP